MRGEKFREASAHASGEVSACVFLVGNHPTSRLRLSRHFLIARLPLLRDAGGEFLLPRKSTPQMQTLSDTTPTLGLERAGSSSLPLSVDC